jgi:hypothetical protein
MTEIFPPPFSSKLRNLTAELRLLDRDFKSNPTLEGAALREFRQSVDNIRMTAWTAHEVLNARESQRNPQAVLSFLTAERLRRLSQMVQDLTGDLDLDDSTWPTQAVNDLENSINLLSARLRRVGESG